MSNRPWMPLNVADYLKDTRHLTTLEHGAYLLLIMRYWEDGELPDSEALIARYAGLTPDQWAESRDILAALFGPGWTHKRIDAELARAAEVMEKRRASGKLGGSTRQASAKHVPADSQHTDKDKDTDKEKKTTRRAPSALDGFAEWYALYPNKVQRGAAEKAWPKARANASQADLIDGLQRYIASKPPDRPWQNPATWLNGKGWLDRPATVAPQGQGPPGRVQIRNRMTKLVQEMEQADAAVRSSESDGSVRQAIPNLSLISGGNRG